MLAVVSTVERKDVAVVHKIDKGISAIALVLEINWQVEEVDRSGTMPILGKFGKQHLLSVLVGDVADHERCTTIPTILHCIDVQLEVPIVLFVPIGCAPFWNTTNVVRVTANGSPIWEVWDTARTGGVMAGVMSIRVGRRCRNHRAASRKVMIVVRWRARPVLV